MARLRTVVIDGAAVALLALSLAIPAAAADTKGTLAIVNGIPGKRVDVCLNGNEIRSDLAYGSKVLKNVVGTGSKHLKFYAHDPRTCRGHQVGQESFTLDPAEDLTIVVTKNPDKVVVFSNNVPFYLGEIPPAGAHYAQAIFAWRDAAEMPVTFRYRIWTPGGETPIGLSADPVSNKGQQVVSSSDPEYIWQVRVTLPNDPDTIAVRRAAMEASHRYEWVLVGSNPGNAKFVFLDRAVSQPSP